MLATKLFRPGRRAQLVDRTRLVRELDRSLDDANRLTLVAAPAGFGKTTLLSTWLDLRATETSDVAAGWLSLDAGDDDPSRFLRHLVAALRQCGVPLDDPPPEEQAAADLPAVLSALVNAVVEAGAHRPERHWVVVLDDYHLIESPAVHEAVSFLLDNLPRQLHLVVATRADPPWPLSRMRVRGHLVELRARDLRFTASEAADFLDRVMGLDLTPDDVAALGERTEGWVAGLQLAALSLQSARSREETDDFIAAFTGSNRFVLDYLVDEVLSRLPAESREFMMRTSVLGRLTGSLCDAVTGGALGTTILHQLERDNLFVVPLDEERSWYRYHHLLADVLQSRLRSTEPRDVVSTLHARASAWYAEHDLLPDAVHHALAGGDHARAGYLVEAALPQTRRLRQDSALLGWIDALPESVIGRSPVLSIAAGWAMMIAGDLEAMERHLDDADTALAAGAGDANLRGAWADTDELRTAPATLEVHRAALAQARGDVPATVDHARQALALAGPDDHLVRGGASGFLGLGAWAAGDVDRALATFSDAVTSLRAAGNLVDALDSTVVLADMWMTAGRPSRARTLLDDALRTATRPGRAPFRAAADLHVALADLDRERDALDEARAHLDAAQGLRVRGSITENRHQWYVVAARVAAATGDHASALDLLDQAQAVFRAGTYPDIRPIPAMRARVHLQAGDLDSARRWARGLDVGLDDDVTFLREYELLTLVRLHLASHLRDESPSGGPASATAPLDRVLEALDRVRHDAEPTRAATLLEVGMLRALTLHAAGDDPAAVRTLEQARREAPEPASYVRLLLDEGAPLADLETTPASERLARRGSTGLLSDPLSERELQVLRMLATDLTGPEIARHLYVSLNTLRTHTKRIFTKLDVTNRAAAVRRGRELDLT